MRLKKHSNTLLLGSSTVIILALYITIELAFNWFNKHQRINPWALIPESTVVVIEAEHLDTFYQELEKGSIWKDLNSIVLLNDFIEEFKLLRQLLPHQTQYGKGLISLSTEGVKPYSLSVILPLQILDDTSLPNALQQLTPFLEKPTKQRTYKGTTIWEAPIREKTFYLCQIRNYLIGSWDGVMIEAAIRQTKILYPKVHSLKTISKEHYAIHLNTQQLDQLFYKLDKTATPSALAWLKGLGEPLSLGIQRNDDTGITLQGNPQLSPDNPLIHRLQLSQAPKKEIFQQWLPEKTAYYFRFSITDNNAFQEAVEDQVKTLSPQARVSREKMKALGFDLDDFYEILTHEVGKAAIYRGPDAPFHHLTFCQLKNKESLSKSLQELHLETARNEEQHYRRFSIKGIRMAELPEALLGKPYQGYEQMMFYTFYNNYLIMGESMETIKHWIRSLAFGEIWGKKDHCREIIEKHAEGNRFSFVLQGKYFWSSLLQGIHTEWATLMEKEKRKFLAINFISLQQDTEQLYLSLHKYNANQTNNTIGLQKKFSYKSPHHFAQGPWLIGQEYLLIQDYNRTLRCFSKDGELLWQYPLNTFIIDGIHLLFDAQKGQKYIAFANDYKVFVLTPKGNLLPDFPLEFPEKYELKQLGMINTAYKAPHLITTDYHGNAFLFNLKGEVIGDWSPKRFLSPLVSPAFYTAINGQEYIVTVSKNGQVGAYDWIGNPINGFPMQFRFEVEEKSSSLIKKFSEANSKIALISKDGSLAEVNLQGNVTNRIILGGPHTKAEYKIIRDDVQGELWIVVKKDGQKVTLINEEGNVLFSKSLDSDNYNLQYFHFGVDAEIIAINLPESQKTHLFYINGDKVLNSPINSSSNIQLSFDSNHRIFSLYSCFGKQLNRYDFKD
ncbi:hypothetical protein [Algivirga pacifica]|uniref:PQQ-like domain-containing protein n=1 Tax=Algivirga pacifica TaxID=1162670 RepID=A0ABP9DAT4_9BACT